MDLSQSCGSNGRVPEQFHGERDGLWVCIRHPHQNKNDSGMMSNKTPGMDLTGNTFWEFTDQINIGRLRRIVEYDKNEHYADVKLARTQPLSNPPRRLPVLTFCF